MEFTHNNITIIEMKSENDCRKQLFRRMFKKISLKSQIFEFSDYYIQESIIISKTGYFKLK